MTKTLNITIVETRTHHLKLEGSPEDIAKTKEELECDQSSSVAEGLIKNLNTLKTKAQFKLQCADIE
tara:strand:+ start:217 stop:417 length:201 start_codon:yes stop_codon:yes gene_type:complete